MIDLRHGDALDVLATLPDASVDAIVTDPPAGIAFMGKEWDTPGAFVERKPDKSVTFDLVAGNHHPEDDADRARTRRSERAQFVARMTPILAEALRVLKPGGRALVWSIPRTSHWTGCAIEDAGFLIENCVYHHFGSGFPKGKSQLKPSTETWWLARKPGGKVQPLQIDACRVGVEEITTHSRGANTAFPKRVGERSVEESGRKQSQGGINPNPRAGRWPPNLVFSHHPDCREVGTRRVPTGSWGQPTRGTTENANAYHGGRDGTRGTVIGYGDDEQNETVAAWECADGCPVKMLDEQSGERKGDAAQGARGGASIRGYTGPIGARDRETHGDTGGASRFFPQFPGEPYLYCPKSSRRERNAGCEGLHIEGSTRSTLSTAINNNGCIDCGRSLPAGRALPDACPRCGGANLGRIPARNDGSGRDACPTRGNTHCTVKPIALMRWLCRLITPPGGTVLDCFAGSGSTLVACVAEGFNAIGIEREAEYIEIARARVAHAEREAGNKLEPRPVAQLALLGGAA